MLRMVEFYFTTQCQYGMEMLVNPLCYRLTSGFFDHPYRTAKGFTI